LALSESWIPESDSRIVQEREMARARAGDQFDDLGRFVDGRRFESAAGLRILVPGWPHFCWGQRQRGWVLLGTFLGALVVGLFTWGTPLCWGFVALAFISHVASATLVLRQSSFPIYAGRMSSVYLSGALALFLYLPLFLVLSLLAWPGFEPAGDGIGFLVNRCAYRSATPRSGHWIWVRASSLGQPRAAQVVAVSGQEVEWTGRNWRVDGQERSLHPPIGLTAWPQTCRFKVPADQILVEPQDDGVSSPPLGPVVLVSRDRIIGRAWAQFYPIWERRLL
jgi:hypothetical protein